MLTLREATPNELDFLLAIDLKDEGIRETRNELMGLRERAEHRDKIAAFVSDSDKGAWVYQDSETSRLVGMILWRFVPSLSESVYRETFKQLDRSLFPDGSAFCEIFQLWVALDYRRQGLATALKRKAETESISRDIKLLYTHTEEQNKHVVALNLKLGYREIRRGPIWDDVVRVSLIKTLE